IKARLERRTASLHPLPELGQTACSSGRCRVSRVDVPARSPELLRGWPRRASVEEEAGMNNLTQTADLGLRFASADMTKKTQGATTGVLMGDVGPKMEQIKVSANALNTDIMRNVADPIFRQHWAEWYASWNKYYSDVNTFWMNLFSNPWHANEI